MPKSMPLPKTMTLPKTIAVAIIAALAGAVATEVVRVASPLSQLIAQEPPGQSFVQPPVPARTGTVSRLPVPPSDSELSAEERINIAVYEKVNRSVVNIKTETVRTDAFFFLATETPGEGAGSGSVLDTPGTHPHQLPRDRRRPGDRGHAVRRRRATRPASSAHDESNDVAVLKINAPADFAGAGRVWRFHELARRTAGVCDRQSVRLRTHADHRHHLQPQPHAAGRAISGTSNRSSRSTPRSTPATRAARCWTATAA